MSAETHNPLEQFAVKPIFSLPSFAGYPVDFTNSALFMVLATLTVLAFFAYGTRSASMVPGRMQLMAEMGYEFIAGMLRENVGPEGKRFFPIMFSLFMFILACNLLGMIPYSFTVTSHIIVTFAFAAFIFVGVTLIAIVKHGPKKFIGFFLPHGIPAVMAPIMFVIELISYLARPVSLSVRLAANMMAGHTMLKVIAGFVFAMGFLGGWLPLAFLVVMTGFEFFVAILQAYIFTILTCVYLNDAIHLH